MRDIKQKIADLKVLIAVPTYNNATTIAQVVKQIQEYSDDIVVINDGSTDNTQTILDSLAIPNISYTPNRGKGYAIRQLFHYAKENGYNYVLTIDSDGQHYASDIAKFIEQITLNPDSLIIGSRNLKADNMPSKNTFANKFSNFWYVVETGKTLDDTQSGYRLYPIRKIGGMRFFSNRYEFEVEVIVRAAWKGINVYNIPIQVYYPPQEERVSHFKPLKDFTRISILNTLLVIIALLFYYPYKVIKMLTKENVIGFIKSNITESKDSNHCVAASIGLGVFFGIVPIWGYQMIVAGVTAHYLKLNKVLTLISSNISIPPMIPFILYGSFYTGGILLGADTRLSFSEISFDEVYKDIVQYVFGALALSICCGIIAYVLTFVSLLLFKRKVNG
jgi:glycosyltransferase involved in cell wall biosynthesis